MFSPEVSSEGVGLDAFQLLSGDAVGSLWSMLQGLAVTVVIVVGELIVFG